MDYTKLVIDFAERTKVNMDHIFMCKKSYGRTVYEVSQMINSLLGVIVIPQQKEFTRIPDTPLYSLPEDKWPSQVRELEEKLDNFQCLIYCMRHSIAHGDFTFEADSNEEISSITFKGDCRKPRRNTEWSLTLSPDELRQFVDSTCELWKEHLATEVN